MTCDDCIHSEVCCSLLIADEDFEITNPDKMANSCNDFADRSRFVELPCKINQKLYTHDGKSVLEAIAIGVNIIQMPKEKVKEITLTIPQIGKYFMIRQPFSDIGKKYFFTREEAEQAFRGEKNK